MAIIKYFFHLIHHPSTLPNGPGQFNHSPPTPAPRESTTWHQCINAIHGPEFAKQLLDFIINKK